MEAAKNIFRGRLLNGLDMSTPESDLRLFFS